jgi:hypothetical protein
VFAETGRSGCTREPENCMFTATLKIFTAPLKITQRAGRENEER